MAGWPARCRLRFCFQAFAIAVIRRISEAGCFSADGAAISCRIAAAAAAREARAPASYAELTLRWFSGFSAFFARVSEIRFRRRYSRFQALPAEVFCR